MVMQLLTWCPVATAACIGLSAVAESQNIMKPVVPVLQYGAFALCAIMVYLMRDILQTHRLERADLMKDIRSKDTAFNDLIAKNHKVLRKLAEVLEDRPCLKDDQRAEVDK